MNDSPTSNLRLVELRKAARAVYAQCRTPVADDMARIFNGAADEIEHLTADRDSWKARIMHLTEVEQDNELLRADLRTEDFKELVKIRQSELNYVRGVLNCIRKREGEPARAQCLDLLLWCDSRANVLPWPPESPAETGTSQVAAPRESDWKCTVCDRANAPEETHCVHCDWSRKTMVAGVLHERGCQNPGKSPCQCGARNQCSPQKDPS